MTSKLRILIACLYAVCLSMFNLASAQTGITIKKPLAGNQNQLAPDSSVTVIDSMYYDPAFTARLDKPYPVRNIVTFKLDETSNIYLGNAISATALLRIVYTNESGVTDSIEKSFAINYEEGKTYTARQSFVFNNAHKVTVRVLNATITSGGAYTIGALMVENQMDLFPHYKFVCATDAVQSVNFTTPSASKPDELSVSWPTVSGATEYDLEWAYADSFALASSRYLVSGQPSAELIFAHNATRITTANLSYNIPLLFDHAGSLFFRVRAVSSQDKQRRIETNWSSSFTGGLGRYDFAGHEPDLNWQSTVSYAEEGKRKAVVQYYDGSLRGRQTVTKDNTTGTTVVAETLYDFQGRPSIQVMPAPTLNTIIGYSKQFNVGLNGAEYEKQVYDSITPGGGLSAPAMGTQSGASQYYSGNNPLKTGYHAFIPDANGYVFTQTKYTQDNTGRIAAQGGVGEVYQLGKGHETKYYYGSPDQSELDALFGTEVGDASHYFKNMVQDANGQFSISYVDMHGRTIATALAGTPDSVKLATLPSYASRDLTENLLTTRAVKDLVMESKKSLLVSKEGVHSFHYGLDPQSLQKDGCNAQTFCYSCLYDLEIKITGDDSNINLPGGVAYIQSAHNFSLSSIPADCNGQSAFNLDFNLNLKPGSYEITKTLSINREGAAYLRDSLFLARNTCISYEQQVAIQRLLQKESSCEPDCASCTAALGSWDSFRDNYMTQAGIAVSDSAANRGAALAAYTAAQEACKSLCDKRTAGDDARSAMLQDMSAPSGQYADITRSTDKYSIFYDDPATDTDIPYYKTASLVYLNEEGQPDLVYSDSTQTYVTPQQLGAAEFAAKFKTSWAAALLPHHPEYCKLQVYESNASSLAWDRAFESTDTYADAVSKGYLNPTGASTAPFSQYAANSSYTDPLSLVSTTFKARLQDSLQNYRSVNVGSVSLWAVASFMTKCVNSDAACAEPYRLTPSNCFNSSWCDGDKDMAWRAFRTLYLNLKQNIYGELQNSCTPTGQQLLTAGHTLNFQNASTALAQNGLGSMSGITDEATAKAAAAAQLAAAIDSNCHAYVKMWVKQLAPCSYNASDVTNILIPKLLQVCKEGGDVSHPFGASTVKPGSSYSYHSFTEVLNEFKQQHPGAVTDVAACNAELITAPQPYDQQRAYSNKPIWNKPDSCECNTINNLYNAYLANREGANSFSFYIQNKLGTTISDADLVTLIGRCNTISSCAFLAKPISLPPALQCNIGSVCISCIEMDTLHVRFVAAYPGIVPTISETDSVQQLKNQLYANFMNNRLGFSKQAWEYLQFRHDCHVSDSGFTSTHIVERFGVGGAAVYYRFATTTPYTCDSLQSIKRRFHELYPSGDSTLFRAYFNNVVDSNYTLTQINSFYSDACGTVSSTLKLCGKAEPVYPDSQLEHVSACSDSTNFIISTATDIFNARRDSLKGSFDAEYFAKCLTATRYETFTVTHASSEYHYTLYYYDQAGNLLKTVPPNGVVYDNSSTWLAQVAAARGAGTALPVNHTMVTSYRYNTLNQVVTQSSPDGGTSNFWYDRLGRLAISQNAKQLDYNQYSYTSYDYLGRITEVGQLTSTTAMDNTTSRSAANLNTWLSNVATSREQITKTVYDEQYGPLSPVMDAKNLRTRVSYTALYNNNADYVANNHASATYYTYDIHGNVDTLLQDYRQGVMAETGNRFKKIVYRYDLISGKVNHVAYQPNQADAFYHRYYYDAENRVTSVETSRDSITWEIDARYNYYKHGPLARSVIGQLQVQGLDYAYTLQGWMKGLNSTGRDIYDMGHDNRDGLVTADDALAFSLHYFGDADYKPIDATKQPFAPVNLFGSAFKPLYNGNIAAMSSALASRAGQPILSIYSYDQLNRITESQSYGDYKRNENRWEPVQWKDFYERFSYDANGNIERVKRNGMYNLGNDAPTDIDSLHYYYKPGTNQLDFVADSVNTGGWPYDLKMQSPGNYVYDKIGNLIYDQFNGITNINWTEFGKIDSITKSNGATIKYTYDASGNRISKTVYTGSTQRKTWYARDAKGNTMITYEAGDATVNNGELTVTETYLYGNNRVGLSEEKINVQNLPAVPATNLPFLGAGYMYGFTRGIKGYELSNHLGNVMVVLSDAKRIGNANTSINVINSYDFQAKMAQDFYVFGMPKYGRRNYDNQSYRYGFNGKENENDVQGEYDLQDYGMRIYDPRLGRFLSVDPLTVKYPELTPYQFAGNTPVQAIDLDGLEPYQSQANAKALEIARIFRMGIEKDQALLKQSTDITVSLEINKRLKYNRDAYSKWIVYIYQHRQSDKEIAAETILKTGDKAEPILRAVVPADEVKTLITGTDLDNQPQSRLKAAVILALTFFTGDEFKAFSNLSNGLKYANKFAKCEAFAAEFMSKFARTFKKAGAEMKLFKIDIGGYGLIGDATKQYADNGIHFFVEVIKDGKSMIFDNLNPGGIAKEEYIKLIAGQEKNSSKIIEGAELLSKYTKEITK